MKYKLNEFEEEFKIIKQRFRVYVRNLEEIDGLHRSVNNNVALIQRRIGREQLE